MLSENITEVVSRHIPAETGELDMDWGKPL